MKILLYLGIILMFASCGPNQEEIKEEEDRIRMEVKAELEEEKRLEEEERINRLKSSYIKIGNLEVMTEDLGKFEWDDAMKACADLGDGWRLPTNEELNVLYENKDEIGGFANNYYWSSTEVDNVNAWIQLFSNGFQYNYLKNDYYYVRAVRAISESATSTLNVSGREVSTIKISNLEVMTRDLVRMTWDEAKKACADLGDGWRLPTKEEFNILFQNKDKIGGFAQSFYWSSTEDDFGKAWLRYFNFDGHQSYLANKSSGGYVRAVRAISEITTSNESESATSTLNVSGREVSTIKIGNLEVMTEDLGKFEWDDAMKACADLGDGWRLPTKEELNILFENKEKIGVWGSVTFWSSTEWSSTEFVDIDDDDYDDEPTMWTQNFNGGYTRGGSMDMHKHVLAVRSI